MKRNMQTIKCEQRKGHYVKSVYHCNDNDTVITTTYLDGLPDEVSIQIPGDAGALIVGYRDLLQATVKAMVDVRF